MRGTGKIGNYLEAEGKGSRKPFRVLLPGVTGPYEPVTPNLFCEEFLVTRQMGIWRGLVSIQQVGRNETGRKGNEHDKHTN